MNKKLIIALVFVVFVFSVFLLLSKQEKTSLSTKEDSKIKVVTSIYPIFDITRQVAGEKAEVLLLVPPGASPHTFEASPQLVKSVSEAEIFLSVGAGFDDWTNNLIESAESQNITKVDLSQIIDLMPFAEHKGHAHKTEEGGEYEHGDLDPHYWLDPQNGVLLAMSIRDTLSMADPDNREVYSVNADKFIQELSSKDTEWKAKLDSLSNKKIVVFHDAWGYFAKRFGLQVVAVFEIFPGKTPSPKYVIELADTVNKGTVKAIFVEPQLSQDAVRALAKDLDIEVGVLDPLGGFPGRLSYIETLEYNVNQVHELLK